MTGKSNQATREQRGNLGQKQAERQKESESQMRQMGEAIAKQQSGSAARKQSKG